MANNDFTASGVQTSPGNMGYSSVHSSTLQQPPQNRSRLRAASATLPLGLDLRTQQYRSLSSGQGLQSSPHLSTSRGASTASYPSSSTYTSSYPSAPLTAPVDFSHPRTPGARGVGHEYSMPQLSAPIAPSHGFSQALHGNMPGSSTRTPMRDTFGGGPVGNDHNHGMGDRGGGYSPDTYDGSGAGLKRKRSFSMSQTGQDAGIGSQQYGHHHAS